MRWDGRLEIVIGWQLSSLCMDGHGTPAHRLPPTWSCSAAVTGYHVHPDCWTDDIGLVFFISAQLPQVSLWNSRNCRSNAQLTTPVDLSLRLASVINVRPMAACRAAPPPRYHSPFLASVNGRCMALTVTLNLTLTLTLTLALKLHSSSLFTE